MTAPRATVIVRQSDGVMVTATMVGRMTRVRGVAVAAEVAYPVLVSLTPYGEGGAMLSHYETRYTLVPAEDVQADSDEAVALMADAGPKTK